MRKKSTLDLQASHDETLLARIIALESQKDALKTARKLLSRFGSLNAVLCASREMALAHNRQSYRGAKAVQLVSEVALQILHGHVVDRPVIADNWHLHCYLLARLDGLSKAHLWVLYLDGTFRIVDEQCLGVGTVGTLYACPNEIIRPALRANASAMILAQSRAGGSLCLSDFDMELTESVRTAAELFSIAVLDHLIVANGHVFSIRMMFTNDINKRDTYQIPKKSSCFPYNGEGLPPRWWRNAP
jgi:DNA repair protein RadC